jgi:molecular chaperone DnaK
MVYQVQKQITEAGANLPANVKQAIEDEIASAKKVLDKQDATKDELKGASDKLMKVLQDNAQHLQQASQAQAGASAGAGASQPQGSAPKNDGVDADFEVVDDEKPKSE